MIKTDSFYGNKKLSLNQNFWHDHATMQQDVLLYVLRIVYPHLQLDDKMMATKWRAYEAAHNIEQLKHFAWTQHVFYQIKDLQLIDKNMEQFFCVALGSSCYLLCLDSCLQPYFLRKIKTARFMLCLKSEIIKF